VFNFIFFVHGGGHRAKGLGTRFFRVKALCGKIVGSGAGRVDEVFAGIDKPLVFKLTSITI
jgi:hypothetical protein